MKRVVEPEWLDELPPDDPKAIWSRQDLRRINGLMAHVRLMSRLVKEAADVQPVCRIVELGAGDGTFLLKLVRRLRPQCSIRRVVLVDQQPVVSAETYGDFSRLGCEVEVVKADVFEWLVKSGEAAGTAIVANLFLHHFQDEALRVLFRYASNRGQLFVACEPRRSSLALTASRLLGVIGCNAVTRHDAVISVRAGFSDGDLTALWPLEAGWYLSERAGEAFSHCFLAHRPSQQ